MSDELEARDPDHFAVNNTANTSWRRENREVDPDFLR